MRDGQWVSLAGLVLFIVAAVVLCATGLPLESSRPGRRALDEGHIRRSDRWAWVGLICLMASFVLQVLGILPLWQ